jgi:hypothetical protein
MLIYSKVAEEIAKVRGIKGYAIKPIMVKGRKK